MRNSKVRTVLVIRRADKLPPVIEALEAKGYKALGVPIVSTVPQAKAAPPEGVEGIVLTSSAAVAGLLKTETPCYCVGPKTATEAEGKGFNVAYTGAGSGADLGAWLQKNILPQTLYHPTTQAPTPNWYSALKAKGFNVIRQEVYRTELLATLAPEVICCLAENDVSYCMTFSPRGGVHFLALLRREGLVLAKTDGCILTLSHAAADPFLKNSIQSARVFVAPAPTTEALIDVLEQQAHP